MEVYKIREELLKGKRLVDLPLRVTFYARVSTDSDEQLNSLDNQIEYFESYIKEISQWTYIEGYIDEGISGSSVKNRKKFLKMIDDSKSNCFDLILTKEVSRFSRHLADSIKYTQELMSCGVGVSFLAQGINTFDSNSEFILNMMGSLAQEEVKRLSSRVKFGHAQAIKRGRILGSNRITGYKKNNGTLVLVEEEANFIKKLFELYASGKYGFYNLAIQLKNLGYLNTKGKIYDKSSLQRMIKNPKYKGFYSGKTTETINHITKQRIKLPKEKWVVYKDDSIPAIVSEELWERANNLLDARSEDFKSKYSTKSTYGKKFSYSGVIFCDEHNTLFQRQTGTRKKKRPIWCCGDYIRGRLTGCATPLIAELDLDNIIKEIMTTIFSNKEKIVNEMINFYATIKNDSNYSKEINKIKDLIKDIDMKKDKLLELNIENRITNIELEERNDKLNIEKVNLQKKINKIEVEEEVINKNYKNISNIENKIKQELEFKDSVYDFVIGVVDEIIVKKIDGNRKKVQLDVYLNFGIPFKSNERGSKYKGGKISTIKYIENKQIETVEIKKRNDHILNEFNYSVYITH